MLPPAAWRLDNDPDIRDGETRIEVDLLALDAAFARRLRDTHADDPMLARATLLETVAERGKLHDPVTGAGGTVVGRIGQRRIALPSALSAVPLWLTDISGWDGVSAIVPARGYAIAFARTPTATVPDDLPVRTTLAALDVAAVPSLVRRHVRRGARVAVLDGASIAGAFACVAAREAGASAVVTTVTTLDGARAVEHVGAARPVVADVRSAVAASRSLRNALTGAADLTVSCVDITGAEGTALLTTADDGIALFTSRATSFADLVTEAGRLSSRCTILAGGGHEPGETDHALDLVRTWPALSSSIDARAASTSSTATSRVGGRGERGP